MHGHQAGFLCGEAEAYRRTSVSAGHPLVDHSNLLREMEGQATLDNFESMFNVTRCIRQGSVPAPNERGKGPEEETDGA